MRPNNLTVIFVKDMLVSPINFLLGYIFCVLANNVFLHSHIYIGLYLFRKTANINSKNFSVYEAVNGVSHTYKTANFFFDLSLYHGIQAGINVGLRGTITRQFYFSHCMPKALGLSILWKQTLSFLTVITM